MSGATEPVDWDALNEKLPFEKNKKQKQKRKELFKRFDPNGNGYLSLAEVRSVKSRIRSALKKDNGSRYSDANDKPLMDRARDRGPCMHLDVTKVIAPKISCKFQIIVEDW